jgi:mannose-6-phosphate isomerase
MATEYRVGQNDVRPWGTWEVIAAGPNYAVKQIVVKPGQRLSLQRHLWRGEHWTIVSGIGEVTRDGLSFRLAAGQYIFIGIGDTHRMANPGTDDLIFIEVQHGVVLDENDIQRLDDDYGRTERILAG